MINKSNAHETQARFIKNTITINPHQTRKVE